MAKRGPAGSEEISIARPPYPDAARPLQPRDRDRFLRQIAEALVGMPVRGPGNVHRAIRLGQCSGQAVLVHLDRAGDETIAPTSPRAASTEGGGGRGHGEHVLFLIVDRAAGGAVLIVNRAAGGAQGASSLLT